MAEENLPVEGGTTEAPAVQAPTAPTVDDPKQKKSFIDLFKDWPLSRKIALFGVICISVILFSLLIIQGRTADYQLLYANLAETDAAPVVNWLKAEKIPYKLKSNGRDIWIPADIIHETRLSLASNGLPTGGGIGFEVFDKQSFALTDYVQKVNFTRALQGELSRTITSLEPVDNARVHLALPEKRLFKNQQKQASASVIVNLRRGQSLDSKQVQGIIHLVAGSITGLPTDNVTVIDENGVVLNDKKKKDDDGLLSADMLSFQQEVEHRLEMRAQELLLKTMGKDKAMVRVSATLDFSKVEQTKELYDGEEPAVRSEQVTEEKNGIANSGGIPGVQSNVQGVSPQAGGENSSSRSSRTMNYEINKTVSRISNPVGTIQKLSVSILVADKVIPASGDQPERTESRSESELQSIQTMVSAALGLVLDRGDQISVISMPFTETADELLVSESLPENFLYDYIPFIKIGLFVMGAMLLYFLLIRPVIKTMRGDVEQYYKTVETLEREKLEEEERLRIEAEAEDQVVIEDPLLVLRREIIEDPTATAHILKSWIQET